MNRRGLQLGAGHKLALFTAGGLLLVSGAAWAWVQHIDEAGRAGEALRDFKPWLLKVHGLSAMGFVLILGTLLVGHVRAAWRARTNLANGAFFFVSVSLLTLSGYLLYYIGGEELRSAVSRFHLWLGLAAPILLAWHLRRGKGLGRREPRGAAALGRNSPLSLSRKE